ncbi:3-isopropylmalate dehydratase large subunit (plasmid) [Roseomonas mucosa]|uniref:3-isopropylmalate dehydratase large subunit n=1 Tax=Roseomonas mucosa TaxID=207340 RepID=A0A4Y1MTA3_9PROT|nr:aconitase family protein [Roseomonas mucosa]AWV20684.1 3-isopropylmalate dehydratase large subunit [Roseomonas mucosa]MDT8356318.1 aconitase family protein [Roseomonas mucosa]
MSDRLELPGRVLFLSGDPELVTAQLGGCDLTLAEAGRLRDDVSTDEITPLPSLVHFDEALADHAYTGVKCDDALPFRPGAARAGGFSVVVAGARYGKGSSREHSPLAEKMAGIRLVIAESFERIYRQNADNLGLFTSTDFGLVERIRRGESIGVEELVAGRDAVTAAVLRAGGLLAYGRCVLRHASGARPAVLPGPQTLAAKILARHAVAVPGAGERLEPGSGIFVRADLRFIHDIYTAMCRFMLRGAFGETPVLEDPGSILTFEDHYSYAHRSPAHVERGLLPHVRALSEAHRAFVAEHGLTDHGYLPGGEGSEGISHAQVAERYALPGRLIVGTDSHTPHSGALGCLAFGVGTTDMANAMVTGMVRLRVPEVLRIEMQGSPPPGVTAKDIVLHLLARPGLKAGTGVGKVFEFAGPGVACLGIDERATLTNMTAELGGFAGIVAPDAETQRFLRDRRGIDFEPEPWMCSDPGAPYAEVITLDLSHLSPMLAAPGDPGRGVPVAALDGPVRIDIAYGGSCTAGKREDFDHYHEVLAWAVARGLRPPPHVRLLLQFGTAAVRDYCAARGYLDTFARIGAEILQPACGACANCGPGVSVSPSQVTVSAINRNFPGRSGPGQVWLASPPTVAASAIAGELISFQALRERYPLPMPGLAGGAGTSVPG